MKKPVSPTRAKRKDPNAPVAPDLSWREFFVRLGDGTLHDEAARQACRAAPDRERRSLKRPAVTAPR